MPATVIPERRLFVSVAEAAVILETDPRTVRRALQEGQIPGFKVGTFWKIPVSWLRKQAGMGDGDAATA